MAHWRCNTCGGTYQDVQPDGTSYFHACPPLVTPGAQPDASKPGFTPPTEKENPDKRDENLPAGVEFIEGKPVRLVQDANDANVRRRVPVASLVKSEGKGRTQI